MTLAAHWMAPIVFLGVVLTAFLVNRYAPAFKRRLPRIVIVFALYVVCLGASVAIGEGSESAWASRFRVGAQLFEDFTIVNIVATLVFDIFLPKVKLAAASILTDIIVGLAYLIVTIAALKSGGMKASDVVTTSAVVSGVLALSMQTTLGNILGGVALQVDGSIHVGDWVQLENGKQGRVKNIRWRHTVIETRDWSTIIVPNASLLSSNITILGKRNGEAVPQRMWVYFQVDFRYPPSHVVQVVSDAMKSAPIERVSADPAPSVICMDLARDGKDSFALYAVRYWLTDLAVDDPTSSLVRARIHAALRRANIPLARPTQSLFINPDDETEDKRREEKHHKLELKCVESMKLFDSLTHEEKETLTHHMRFAPFTAGEIITRQGAVAHWLYVISEGTAEVRTHLEDTHQQKLVATLTAPNFFGEMGLMTGEPRFADVVAKTDVDCFRLDKSGFEEIILKRPEIAGEMSVRLAERRVELIAIRDGLDEEARKAREKKEQEHILGRIQDFFGLSAQSKGR
jgi:small-conductance mechanosensitive channel/CRP-like cAMP-binding protein